MTSRRNLEAGKLVVKAASAVVLSLVMTLLLMWAAFSSVFVKAEGVAALSPNVDPAIVLDEAIRDAWRRAAEQGAGLLLHAEARIENLILISSAVSTCVDAIIVDYDILRQWEDDVFLRVEILAEVDTLELGRTLEDLGVSIESIGDPRTAVRISETHLGEPQVLSIAEAVVRDALKAKGFVLIEPNEASGVPFSSLGTADPQMALELAQAYDADIAIVGRASSVPCGSLQRGAFTWYSATGFVDLMAVLRSTGEVLASSYAEVTVPTISLETASIAAIDAAVADALPRLLYDTIANLSLVQGSGLRALQLVVEGVWSFEEAQAVRLALSTLREALAVELRQYGSSITAYGVTYLGPSDVLGSKLESDDFNNVLRSYLGREVVLTIVALDFGSIHVQLGP